MIGLAIVLCALLLPTGLVAKKQVERPMKVHGVVTVVLHWDEYVPGDPFVLWTMTGVAESTHCGRCADVGSGKFYFAVEFPFSEGTGFSTSANGERLRWHAYEVFGTQQVTLTWMGGTGKFATATGGLTFQYTVTEESGPGPHQILKYTYSDTGTGTITY